MTTKAYRRRTPTERLADRVAKDHRDLLRRMDTQDDKLDRILEQLLEHRLLTERRLGGLEQRVAALETQVDKLIDGHPADSDTAEVEPANG